MGSTNNLPLYRSVYKLLIYLYSLISNFKKEYKYTLGQSITDCAWVVLDSVIIANTLPNLKKKEYILKASNHFDMLKTRIRVAYELKLIDNRRYTFIVNQFEEIGKMLNGWYRWSSKAQN